MSRFADAPEDMPQQVRCTPPRAIMFSADGMQSSCDAAMRPQMRRAPMTPLQSRCSTITVLWLLQLRSRYVLYAMTMHTPAFSFCPCRCPPCFISMPDAPRQPPKDENMMRSAMPPPQTGRTRHAFCSLMNMRGVVPAAAIIIFTVRAQPGGAHLPKRRCWRRCAAPSRDTQGNARRRLRRRLAEYHGMLDYHHHV